MLAIDVDACDLAATSNPSHCPCIHKLIVAYARVTQRSCRTEVVRLLCLPLFILVLWQLCDETFLVLVCERDLIVVVKVTHAQLMLLVSGI